MKIILLIIKIEFKDEKYAFKRSGQTDRQIWNES